MIRDARAGMTLIELVIGLALAGIILAIGASTLSDWSDQARAATSARSVADALSMARAEAIRTGSNHIVAFNIVSNANLGTLPTNIVIANDGPTATSNCQIASTEITYKVRLERGISWGSTATLVAPSDPGTLTDATTGSTFKTAANGNASWVMFGADGMPRRFTPNTSATPPCSAVGQPAQTAAAIYLKNAKRNYAIVMTPLGTARVHRYMPGATNRWTQ